MQKSPYYAKCCERNVQGWGFRKKVTFLSQAKENRDFSIRP